MKNSEETHCLIKDTDFVKSMATREAAFTHTPVQIVSAGPDQIIHSLFVASRHGTENSVESKN